jgi:hypothetical protein
MIPAYRYPTNGTSDEFADEATVARRRQDDLDFIAAVRDADARWLRAILRRAPCAWRRVAIERRLRMLARDEVA